MLKKFKKALNNRFGYLAYNVYTADLTKTLSPPVFKKKPQTDELDVISCKNEDLPDTIIIPDELDPFWEKVRATKNHFINVVVDKNKSLAGYLMYTQQAFHHREFNITLVKSNTEAVLSSGRTIDSYLGMGISEYCKRLSLLQLQEKGVKKVYSFSKKHNTAPQHVNRKIGMKLTNTIHVFRIFKRKLVINMPKSR